MDFWNGFEKRARELSPRARKKLSGGEFVFPKERRYPIHDAVHARNALARVAQHGTAHEQAQVRAAVKRKFPNIHAEKHAASKEEVVGVLKKHEDRETPEQEKQESEHEQKVEREEGVEKNAVSLGWLNRRMESGIASRFGKEPSVGVQRSALDALKHYREGNRPAAIKEVRSLRGLSKTAGMKPLIAGAAAIPAVLGASGAMSSDQKPVRHAIMGLGTGAGAGAGLLGGGILGDMLKHLAERNPEKLKGTAMLGKAAPILGALLGGAYGGVRTLHWLAGLDENNPPPSAIGGEANAIGNS